MILPTISGGKVEVEVPASMEHVLSQLSRGNAIRIEGHGGLSEYREWKRQTDQVFLVTDLATGDFLGWWSEEYKTCYDRALAAVNEEAELTPVDAVLAHLGSKKSIRMTALGGRTEINGQQRPEGVTHLATDSATGAVVSWLTPEEFNACGEGMRRLCDEAQAGKEGT